MVDLTPAERAVQRYKKDLSFSCGVGTQWKSVKDGKKLSYTSNDSGIKYTAFYGNRTNSKGEIVGQSIIVTYEYGGSVYRLVDHDADGNFDRVDVRNKKNNTSDQYFDNNDDGDFDARKHWEQDPNKTYEKSKFNLLNPTTWFN